jgi:hypothetical protein
VVYLKLLEALNPPSRAPSSVRVDDSVEQVQRCLRLLAMRGEETCLEGDLVLPLPPEVEVVGRPSPEEGKGEVVVQQMRR